MAEINVMETKRTIQRINENKKLGFFEKINKIDKLLAKVTKRKNRRPKIIEIEKRNGIQQIPMKFRS
jgi:hypothetical protein